MPEPMIRMTDAAAERVRYLMSLSEEPAVGLRVGVRSRGCSGLSYSVEYASERKPYEEAIESNGVTVLIDPTAVMFLIGSVMDYQEDVFESGFTFENPNAKGTCGCGESFHV
ncbi:MAG: iron-sulfur cluster assembly accessory protein [Alphaproteobacteria bacterium]|nr:iron-sulfur cluster assembly accessory protein [Alphaproteobacteria bacterium]MCY4319689.1 iron-sulfur cluster assembly accessory protein [Alphaproteobacteria bacterium]